jgi:hypothetical protein
LAEEDVPNPVLAPPPSRTRPSGPLLFARYAYGPNRLGLCGPDDAASLFGEATEGGDERQVRELARGFEGAYPYLELIARANRRPDPLSADVVEAYWLGGPLVEAVTPNQLADSLRTRFRPRLRAKTYSELRDSAPAGSKPVHAFHVLDVFPRVGLMRSEQADHVVETMDRCRVRWGRVVERASDELVVRAVPLALAEGKLAFGEPRIERITAFRDGRGFIGEVGPGDVISIHWDWACEVLDGARLERLIVTTRRELVIANRTI